MDRLPWVVDVYKRDLDIRRYFIGYLQHPYVSLYTGRGCRSRCTFCLWPQTLSGHPWRVRSVDNVVEEMAAAKKKFPQVREFFFDDDTFTANRPRAEAIARELGKLGITWSCNSRANVPYDTLKVMKDNGLRLLLTGFESGNAQILRAIKKGVMLDRARRYMKDCKKLGIKVHGTFILGLPGETPEPIQRLLGAKKAACFDISAACSGFLYGIEIAQQWGACDDLIAGFTLRRLDSDEDSGRVMRFDSARSILIVGRPDPGRRFEHRLSLSARLAAGLGRDLDLVLLNDAPPLFARHIVTHGRRLVCTDRETDHAFVRDAQLRAADIEPFIRRMRQIRLERLAGP